LLADDHDHQPHVCFVEQKSCPCCEPEKWSSCLSSLPRLRQEGGVTTTTVGHGSIFIGTVLNKTYWFSQMCLWRGLVDVYTIGVDLADNWIYS